MTETELVYLSAAEQGRLMRAGEVSPVDLVEAYLRRIERYDADLRAYITVTGEQALEQAREAERAIAAGAWRGPLHGVTYGVKDQLRTRGIRTTLGWRPMAEHVPDHDAAVVEGLNAAGAILIGKHNLDQFGKGGTVHWDFGQARNPWDLQRSPGGSSSGSGIAPAAGLCAGALGEDTGGSTRFPGAANGIVGLRPTFGRVSRFGGFMYGWTADTLGPLTRTVEDNALFLQAIAGHDPRDALSSTRAVPDYAAQLTGDIRGLRVGLVTNLSDNDAVDPEISAAMAESVAVLRGLGAVVEETELPLARYSVALLMLTSDVDVATMFLRKWLRESYADIDYGIRTRLAVGCLVPASAYAMAMRGRVLVREEVFDRLRRFDVLICPTSPVPPARIATSTETVASPDEMGDKVIKRRMNTYPFSVANTPCVSIPNGFSRAGLPLPLQIVGRPFAEGTVLRVAHAVEQATPWHRHRPDVDAAVAAFRAAP